MRAVQGQAGLVRSTPDPSIVIKDYIMSLSKKQLVTEIASKVGYSNKDTEPVIDALVSTVQEQLQAGGEVTLVGLGKFSVTERAARAGRNPQTGETVQIAAKKAPKFSVSKTLKDLVA